MNGLSLRDPQVFGTLAAAAICVGGIVVYMAMRKKPTEEELELARRQLLVQTGRIIDGTLLDITDVDAKECGREKDMRLILYKYEIAGVVYECSQDITSLQEFIDVKKCRPGFPATIRYDTRRPENSIIVSEHWSGLRESAKPFPVREPARNPSAATIPRR
jgi:hypothetical protein